MKNAYLPAGRKNEKLKILRGVTLTELLVVIGILIILGTLTLPAIYSFQKESDLDDATREIINNLKLARSKTLVSEGAKNWGVYFTTTTIPHQYTLFKGTSYDSRTISSDEIFKLSKTIEFSEIDFEEKKEVVFNRMTGTTEQPGKVSLGVKDNPEKSRTIYVEDSGRIELSTSSVSDENRLTDSRHIHFNYNRPGGISTSTENLILTFEGGITKYIIIADFIKEGQIYWQGEIDIGGDIQKLKIHTHRLNNPDTQFCIHRDRRYNNKTLSLTISGDGTGNLISYTAAGEESRGTSAHLSVGEAGDPQRQ